MPLAQNYKDDVSLLESETALSKAIMNIIPTKFSACQETNTKTNVSVNLHFIEALMINVFFLSFI
jgi:hypothetical protein